jgi:hypothetical protein
VKGALGTPGGAPAAPHAPAVLKPLGAKAEKDGFTLWASYDPEPQIAIGQPVRLVATILNASKTPQPHVDFDIMVTGPQGLLFSSKSFHEYDGVLEYEVQPFVPGFYAGSIVAHPDEGIDVAVPLEFEVVPPALAATPGDVMTGPGMVSVKGLDKAVAGVPTLLTFGIHGPQGPVQHSEVDVTIFQKGMAPLDQFKLHTHDSGDTSALVVFPTEGDWLVTIDPLPTAPQPVVFFGPGGPGMPIQFAAKVAPGVAGDVVTPQSVATGDQQHVPGAGFAALSAVAALGALAVRRRL